MQKIHKVFDNLCVAFSGDIRSGLLIIEKLSIQIPQRMKENEYFDIDGQLAILVDYLNWLYKKFNPNSKPFLELTFLWTAQEGDDGEIYSALFGSIEATLKIWTVQKFKNLLFHEASKVNHSGVSRTLISFESVINYQDIYPAWIHSFIKEAFIDLELGQL